MQQVRAKFQCLTKNHMHTGSTDAVQIEVRLNAVYANGEANKEWSKWTPNGQITMTITNPAAAELFELGKEYFVDFTPAK